MNQINHRSIAEAISIEDPTLSEIHAELGISSFYPSQRGLPPYYQPPLENLVVVDIDFEGKLFVLIRDAAVAWKNLCEAARRDGIVLQPFSGFRSYRYQAGLVRQKLDSGQTLEEIFKVLAVPGYSEHHTGRAVDITTPGCKPLVEELEETDAFRWLTTHAGSFDFTLSFPRNNRFGFIYEPWHWCYQGDSSSNEKTS